MNKKNVFYYKRVGEGAVSLIYIYISNVQKTSVRGECKLIKVMKEENTLIRGGVVDCR
jgi:hypothetical protein